MKKIILILAAFTVFAASAFSQTDDNLFGETSDDALFGGNGFSSDDELFGGDDDFFFGDDDGIDFVEDTSAKSDLSKGVLFENGSIKIGGSFTTGLSTLTTIYADDDKSLSYNQKLWIG